MCRACLRARLIKCVCTVFCDQVGEMIFTWSIFNFYFGFSAYNYEHKINKEGHSIAMWLATWKRWAMRTKFTNNCMLRIAAKINASICRHTKNSVGVLHLTLFHTPAPYGEDQHWYQSLIDVSTDTHSVHRSESDLSTKYVLRVGKTNTAISHARAIESGF